jgi:hypothetical protein
VNQPCPVPGDVFVDVRICSVDLPGHAPFEQKDICNSILTVCVYREGLQQDGLPFVLGEKNEWLREIAKVDCATPFTATDEILAMIPSGLEDVA